MKTNFYLPHDFPDIPENPQPPQTEDEDQATASDQN